MKNILYHLPWSCGGACYLGHTKNCDDADDDDDDDDDDDGSICHLTDAGSVVKTCLSVLRHKQLAVRVTFQPQQLFVNLLRVSHSVHKLNH